MAVSGCYGNNISPISYVTLAIRTVSCCQCSSVRAHCHSMIFSSRHSNNIRPIRYVTLTKLIISCVQEGSIFIQSYGMESSSADITMDFRPRDQLCKRELLST